MTDPKPKPKITYRRPALVRVGSFEEVARQLSILDVVGGALIVDWSHGRVS